jgi:phosphatidylglycerol:prolipoprotein diacylglycerol transferase
VIFILGYWLALELAARQGRRQGIDGGAVQNGGFYGALAGVAGARLGYVVQYWPVYRANPLGILSLNPQALHPLAGMAIGLSVAGVYLRRKAILRRPLLDALAPGLALFLCALALANLASGAAFGIETQVPWAIELWGARRHPVQLYELVVGVAILTIILLTGPRDQSTDSIPGLRFLLLVALHSGSRLALEPLRASSALLPGGLRTAQVVGLLAMLGSVLIMRTWSTKLPNAENTARRENDSSADLADE